MLALGIGLSFFIQPDKVKSILWIFIGLVILVDAVYKLERAFSQKARGAALWWISLLTAFITLILAGLLMFLQITDEHFMTILSGAFLLANGVFDLAEFVLLIVAAKLAEKKSVVVVEEVDVTEVTDVTDPAEAAVTTDATDVQE